MAALITTPLAGCGSDHGSDHDATDTTDARADAADAPDHQDGGDDVAQPADAAFTLSSGVTVTVSPEGAVRLAHHARPLLGLTASPVRALTFDESYSGPLAIWDFTRRDEARRVFAGAPQAHSAGDAVEVTWHDAAGATALLRVAPGPTPSSTTLTVEVDGAPFDALELAVACDEDASFMGFGAQYNGLEQRGEAFDLLVSEQGIGREGGALRPLLGDAHTTYFPMPWWLDPAAGYGVLLDTPRRVRVDLCATEAAEARLEVTGGDVLRALVFHGPTPLDVIAQLSEVVGRPRQPPAWAFGPPWISAQGGSAAVRAVIDALEAAAVPYGAIWSQDWTGVRVNFDGGLGVAYRWAPDPEHYPDLRALGDDLRARGKRFLGYANPFIDPALPDHFAEMAAAGLLITDAAGQPYVHDAPNGRASHPDLTQPAARAYVEAALAAMVTDHGFDGWMADFGEWLPLDARHADDADPRAAHNLFPIWWHAANRAALDAVRPDGDWVTIARSGWTGVQAHSMIHWVGDQEASWSATDGLPTVVPAMLNLGLSGVPYVTHDIGGFSGGPSTKELYLRWVELGAFTPIMRTHEGNKRQLNHNWNTDAETLAHFRRFARLHEALAPEWAALAEDAAARSTPMVRALALHHPDDPAAASLSDQFLLGESLLVAPVVTEGATQRTLYLPAGRWFHVFSGQPHDGPAWVTVDAPIGAPPVFSKDLDRPDLRAID